MSKIKTGELLPCPFCGQPAKTFKHGDDGLTELSTFDIGCETPNCFLEGGAEWRWNESELITYWNTRTDSLSARIAELEKKRDVLTELILETAESVHRNLPKASLHSTSRKNPHIPLVQALKVLGWSSEDINKSYKKVLENSEAAKGER